MSLLLDALKRAEQEKPALESADGLALLDDSAATDKESDSPLATPPAPVTDNDARASAQAVFSAKQGGSGEAPPAAGRRKAVMAGVAVGTLALVAIGTAYVWLETSGGPPLAKAPTRPAMVTPPPMPAPAPSAGAPAVSAPAPTTAAISQPPASTPDAVKAPSAAPRAAAPQPPRAPAQRVASSARPAAAEAPRFRPETDAPRVPAKVAAGYEALRAGDARLAQSLYREALATDPANIDAHLGLAAAAAKAEDRATAVRHYREALTLDPGNAPAVAGLAALSDFTRADALEAQLRADVSRFPANAALRFTLGGLYAEQSRWNEAQAAFFEAYRLDPENPDLAFNLAVSLEHLGQQRLAADFYERALNGARSRGAQFDPAQASRRLAEIRR